MSTELMKVTESLGDLRVRMTDKGKVSLVVVGCKLVNKLDYNALGEGKVCLSGAGVEKMAAVAGLSLVDAPHVMVNGKQEMNPHLVYDSGGLLARAVHKKLAIGRSPLGQMCIVESTVEYSPKTYHMQDLVKLARKKGGESMVLLGTKDMRPEGQWWVWQGEIHEGVGLWANLGHDEVTKVFDTTVGRKKFGQRVAEGMAKRNAAAHHPAVGGLSRAAATTKNQYGGHEGPASLTVQAMCWRSDESADAMSEIIEQTRGGTTPAIEAPPAPDEEMLEGELLGAEDPQAQPTSVEEEWE
jgi:hypothetical protein